MLRPADAWQAALKDAPADETAVFCSYKHSSMKTVLTDQSLSRLSRMEPRRWLLAVLCDWLVVFASIALCLLWPRWFTFVFGILLIGTRQHALGVLMHEGVHYRITSSRRLNDFLSDWLVGYPILCPTAGYRSFHLEHHRLLDTPNDPERITMDEFPSEWSFPMRCLQFVWLLVRDMSGLWPKPLIVLAQLIWNIPRKDVLHHARNIAALHSVLLISAIVAGQLWTYLLLWLLPLVTVFPACFRIRTVAEHSAVDLHRDRYTRQQVDVLNSTRSTIYHTVLGRFFGWLVTPHSINYHIEHHLYPTVPFHLLPALASSLRREPEFRKGAHTTSNVFTLVKELTNVESGGEADSFSPQRRNPAQSTSNRG